LEHDQLVPQILKRMTVLAATLMMLDEAKSCVASTRIAIEVLKKFNISARPLPVRVQAYNAVAQRLLEEGKREQIMTSNTAWSIGLGYDTRKLKHGFPGHLVSYVIDRYLLDLTIDQLSRPEKHMTLSPLCVDVGADFKSGAVKYTENGDEVYLFYEYASDLETLFRKGNYWTNLPRRQGSIRRITEALAQEFQALSVLKN